MTVTVEVEAEICRLYYAEHWKVGTIATQLGIHPDVVRRVLGLGEPPEGGACVRPRLVDPYREYIDDVLGRYPRLRATRLHDMVRERGFKGAVRTLRSYVETVRPQPRKEAYLRLESLPGEQAQIDWAHVGELPVVGGRRALWVFVMVLSWSRAMWAELVMDLSVHSLVRSLVRASKALGGVTRQWLFDNPKTVVLERHGDATRFHPRLLELCGAMRVQPRLCAVRRPEQKGRVERSIRYLRERFLAGRAISSIDEGNRQLLRFIDEIAHPRPHPRIPDRSVGETFAQERGRLLALPDPLPTIDQVEPVAVDRSAFIRFDTNLYSVPPRHTQRALTLVADDRQVRLLDGAEEVARHDRCWGRRQTVELVAHRQELLDQRRAARDLKGRDRLRVLVPDIDVLLERWVESGRNLGSLVARTIKLLDLYGQEVFVPAIRVAIERGLVDIGALGVLCEHERRARSRPVPVEVNLPDHIADRDVIPHDLERYDAKR